MLKQRTYLTFKSLHTILRLLHWSRIYSSPVSLYLRFHGQLLLFHGTLPPRANCIIFTGRKPWATAKAEVISAGAAKPPSNIWPPRSLGADVARPAGAVLVEAICRLRTQVPSSGTLRRCSPTPKLALLTNVWRSFSALCIGCRVFASFYNKQNGSVPDNRCSSNLNALSVSQHWAAAPGYSMYWAAAHHLELWAGRQFSSLGRYHQPVGPT